MRAMLNSVLILLGIAGVFYVGLCLLLYLQQDRVLFYPGPNDTALLAQWKSQALEIRTSDTRLEGWWADNSASTTPFVILYFGGNAEDVLYQATMAERFNARRMLVVNYRGYGQTQGQPSQAALYADGLAIYDYVVNEVGAEPEHIVVMGRSLGSGVASMLASERSVRAAILITPFDSIRAVASSHYPIFPVKLLLRHPFDSKSFARQTKAPALIIAAAEDRVIPAKHAQALANAWAGEQHLHVLPGVGHNDLELHPDYFKLINGFLGRLEGDRG
jgi:uncharacterized protein